MVLSADLGRSSGLDRFKRVSDKYLSVGLRNKINWNSFRTFKEGYKVFVTSFAPLSMRALEQIRMNWDI